jgi:hypothetical protein
MQIVPTRIIPRYSGACLIIPPYRNWEEQGEDEAKAIMQIAPTRIIPRYLLIISSAAAALSLQGFSRHNSFKAVFRGPGL